jgi:hypothetical protein
VTGHVVGKLLEAEGRAAEEFEPAWALEASIRMAAAIVPKRLTEEAQEHAIERP